MVNNSVTLAVKPLKVTHLAKHPTTGLSPNFRSFAYFEPVLENFCPNVCTFYFLFYFFFNF